MRSLRWNIDSKGIQDIHSEHIQCVERKAGTLERSGVCVRFGKMSWHFSREGPLR